MCCCVCATQIPSKFAVYGNRWKGYSAGGGRLSVTVNNVSPAVIKALFGGQKKKIKARELARMLGHPKLTKNRTNWGVTCTVGPVGEFNISSRNGDLKINGKYGPEELDREEEGEQERREEEEEEEEEEREEAHAVSEGEEEEEEEEHGEMAW
jgi:hypothetical protein